ncbi:MAG: sigma-70 family RNA polymerase sigma factor [Verrucomicrobiales bacterium]|nr:sigma-70 family RNA polymerase sigma factor [Verrucomicrobiales bacterium]MCP5528230.1 sigma-70 family RNA polymerase sigma factor [Verrucomicrobiales bacterium]
MPSYETIQTRRTLLDRVRQPDDDDSWREFCGLYGGFLMRLARSAGLNELEAEEAVHETFVGVYRNLDRFTYDPERCSFKCWLSQMAHWRIMDQFRRRHGTSPMTMSEEQLRVDRHESAELPAPDEFERAWEREWRLWIIQQATQRTRSLVKPKQFQVFQLHVLKEQPVGVVARRLGVSQAQVYVAKLRVGRVFARQIKALERIDTEAALAKSRSRAGAAGQPIAPRSTSPSGGRNRPSEGETEFDRCTPDS